jgi:hypothetical protein
VGFFTSFKFFCNVHDYIGFTICFSGLFFFFHPRTLFFELFCPISVTQRSSPVDCTPKASLPAGVQLVQPGPQSGCVCVFSFFLGGNEDWIQGLKLARQVLYHLSLTPNPFAFSLFFS